MVGYGWWRGLVPAYLWLPSRPLCKLFCGHIHVIVGLVDQGCHYLSLNDMLGDN